MVELLKGTTSLESEWKVSLMLFLAFAAGGYLGLNSLGMAIEAACSGKTTDEPLFVSVTEYLSLARWRSFLYGLVVLILVTGATLLLNRRKL